MPPWYRLCKPGHLGPSWTHDGQFPLVCLTLSSAPTTMSHLHSILNPESSRRQQQYESSYIHLSSFNIPTDYLSLLYRRTRDPRLQTKGPRLLTTRFHLPLMRWTNWTMRVRGTATTTSKICPRRMVKTCRRVMNLTLPVEEMGKGLRGISIHITTVSLQRRGENLRNMTEKLTWVSTITRHMQIAQIP